MKDLKTYLFECGLLNENVSEIELTKAKKEYKKLYFKAYNKAYRETHIRKECLFTHSQFKKIENASKEHKLQTGVFIRESVLAYIDKEYLVKNKDEINDLILQIRKLGNNINQLAKKVNINGVQSFDKEMLFQNLYKIEQIIIDKLIEAKEIKEL